MHLLRICVVISYFASLAAAGIPTASASEISGLCPDSAQQYWKKFRKEALRSNLPKVASWTQFPFELRGTLDESDRKRVSREDFVKVFPKLLTADSGLSPTLKTMKSFLIATTQLSPSFCNSNGNQFRVGAWVFELKAHDWQFVQAFVDE